jgi:PKD repeat protein
MICLIKVIRLPISATLEAEKIAKILLLLLCGLSTHICYSQTNQSSDFNTLQKNFLANQKFNLKIYQERLITDSIMKANVENRKNDSLINTKGYNPLSANSIQPQAKLQSTSAQSLVSSANSENLGFENGFSGWNGILKYNLWAYICRNEDSNSCRLFNNDLLTKNGFDETGIVNYPPVSMWDDKPYVSGNPLRLQPSRHAIIRDKTLVDPYGGFPVFDPNISELGNSISRLGNDAIGVFADIGSLGPFRSTSLYEQESISYTFLVGPNDKYLYINYAVVINEPTDVRHLGLDRTYFSMSLKNNLNQEIACSKVDVYANSVSSNIPGFIRSNVEPWNSDPTKPLTERLSVVYKPWSLALVDLSSYIGTTVTLNFATGDCLSGGHWAYAYVNAYTSTVGIVTAKNDATASEVFCSGEPVSFSSAFTGRFDDETYLWDFGDGTAGSSNTQQSPIHTYTSGGTYTVTLRITSRQINGSCPISKTITVIPSPTATADFQSQNYLCAAVFRPSISYPSNACKPISYLWDFGDGTTSTERNPIHAYATSGTYSVKLTHLFKCNASDCFGEVIVSKQVAYATAQASVETLLIEAETDTIRQVINASAASFSDSWSLPHDNTALSNKSSYFNGTQGVWRNNASYVYNVPRQLSPTTNLAKDGTYTLNQFDWGSAEFNIVPNWIQANTMTQYSPYSYELENKDVLGVYSAALYDYGGHLPSANGVNMRNAEMAFTSFEVSDGKPSGNWMLSNAATPASATYKVPIARDFIVVVEAPLQEFDLVNKVDLNAESFWFGFFFRPDTKPTNFLQDVEVLCKQQHPTNPNWSVLVLGRTPFDGLWYGKITVKKTAQQTVTADFDGAMAHSGKSSLRIMADKTFRQELLEVEEGKSYWVNAWVTVQNGNQVTTPKLADNLGIEITLKNKQGQVAGTVSFQPTGTIIEGWQQVKGTFTSPIKNPLIEIKFKAGSKGTAWYDDLRLQPEKGNMKAYVYNLDDYRLQAILDEENYASFFYYDKEGNLYLTKKETERGIKTVSENVSYQVEKK